MARHLRQTCKLCREQGHGEIGKLAQAVSAADMQDHAMELDRIALWLDESGITEIPGGRTAKKLMRLT